jgi:diadenosine tetraphosphate (Ap4A) HIT family hydrolase
MSTLIPTDCPFCLGNNLLKVPVVAEAGSSYLIEAYGSPGHYLIIPTIHTETPGELPDGWWADVKTLLTKVPDLTPEFNLSFNFGKHAGQTVKHAHLWVIPRHADQPAAGKGLASLISEHNKE